MKRVSLALALSLLAGCSEIPQEAYYNRGSPESLLDMSSEVVNISLADADGMDQLVGWLNQETPSRADLACTEGDRACRNAKGALKQFNVEFNQTAGNGASVRLYYDRVMARDCENRYIDNTINPYNLNHPTFGCSTAVNMVQMVSDRRQFVNPSLTDYGDAAKASQNYRRYLKAPKETSSNSSASMLSSGSGSGSKQ